MTTNRAPNVDPDIYQADGVKFYRYTPRRIQPYRYVPGEGMAFWEYGDGWHVVQTDFIGLREIPEGELPETVRTHARKPAVNRNDSRYSEMKA